MRTQHTESSEPPIYSERDQDFLSLMTYEQARNEDRLRRELGQKAIVKVFGLSGAGVDQIFWSEASGRMLPGDEVGPIVLTRSDDSLLYGLAVWRPSLPSPPDLRQCWTRLIPNEGKPIEPIPQCFLNDDLVRQAMHVALSSTDVDRREASKRIFDDEITPIHAIELELPIELSTPTSVGTHNVELKAFAFDAYDALAQHFNSREDWGDWQMVSFYHQGDDTGSSIILGVFAQNLGNQW